MSWKHSQESTSLPCDGFRLRELRKELGWTQKMLALRSGYSERLIRKAEACENLDPETIETLAETLSENGLIVAPEDLCTTALKLAAGLLGTFATSGTTGVIATCDQYFAPNLEIWIAGDASINPLAGKYYGHKGVEEYFKVLEQTIETLSLEPVFSSHGNEVFVHGVQTVRVVGELEEASVWGVNHYLVENGKIILWKCHYDTAAAEGLMLRARRS